MLQDSDRSRVIAYHSREMGKILLLLLYYYHMEYIYMNDNWRLGQNGTLDLDLVWHSSEARIALVPSMSIEDRPLQWMVVRS